MTRIVLHADARSFLARAEPWLVRAEIEHAMALQTARFVRSNDRRSPGPPGPASTDPASPDPAPLYPGPLYWATVEDGDEILGCAFRTPPYRLGMTALPLDAIPALVDSVGAAYRTLSGVAGPEPAASAFTAAWTSLRGGSGSVQSRQRLLAHRAIVPTATPPRGALRPATGADTPLARQWGAAFAHESGLAGLDGGLCMRLMAVGQLYFWDDGAPRCMLGVLRETQDAAAIGILYTAPELRDRGYATAAVAAFSRHLLERGLTKSYFLLDPSNPAADWLCRRLGYGVVQETVDIDFVST